MVPKETDAADDAQTGTIAWLDLTVPNATEIRDFYCQVIGWSAEDVAMTDGDEPYADYNLLGGDGNPAAGICHARGVNEGLPPVWLLYLPVGDLAESLARVKEEGGTVLKETRRADGELSSAVIQDPVGARIALASA
ncbi:MAG: VOC family protein [Acidobacteriota bacterium]